MKNGKKYPKSFILIGSILAIVAVTGIWYFASKLEQVRITQEFAQSKVSERLPITKTIKILPLLGADLTVNDLQVSFREDAQIAITAKCNVTSKVGQAEVEVFAIGTPEFRRANEAFYFKPSQIELTKFEFSAKSGENNATVAEVSKGILDKQLNGKGAAKLKSWAQSLGGDAAEKAVDKKLEAAREKVADLSPEEIIEKIKSASMILVSDAVTVYLNKCPIKRLEGAKGTIISLAVEKISIDKGELVIDLSLLRLTTTLLIWAFLLVAILVALMTAPVWFEVFAVIPLP